MCRTPVCNRTGSSCVEHEDRTNSKVAATVPTIQVRVNAQYAFCIASTSAACIMMQRICAQHLKGVEI